MSAKKVARPGGRSGVMAPVWAVVLAFLFYGAQLGPEVLDESIHLTGRATRHPASDHFEDPGKQGHSDHCLLSQARGESRALPALVAEPPRSAPAEPELVISQGRRSVPRLSHVSQARAPPVAAV